MHDRALCTRLAGFRHQRLQLGVRDDESRLRIVRDVGHLPVTVEDVDRHEDDAELHAGEVEVDRLDAVREVDAEPVAGGQSARRQYLGHAVAARVEGFSWFAS